MTFEDLKYGDEVQAWVLCKFYGLNPEFKNDFSEDLATAKKSGLIEKDYSTMKLVLSSKSEDELEWVQEYRNLFKGLKPGSMGLKSLVTRNLKRFLKNNPCTKKEIFNAVKRYLNETNPKYTRQADYFIYKNGGSTLLSYLEEQDDEVNIYEDLV